MQTFKHGDKVSFEINGKLMLGNIEIRKDGNYLNCDEGKFCLFIRNDFTHDLVTDLKLVEETSDRVRYENRCPKCVLENNNGVCDDKHCSNFPYELDKNNDLPKSLLTHDPVVGDVLVDKFNNQMEILGIETMYSTSPGAPVYMTRLELLEKGWEFSNKPPKTKVTKEEVTEKFNTTVDGIDWDNLVT